MLLKDRLYALKSLKQEENQLIAAVTLNAADPVFEGHFPGNPVTPGVVQLEMIKELLSIQYDREIALKSISNCKYLAILNPGSNPDLTITLTISETENILKTNAVFRSGDIIFTKISGIYY